MSLSEHSQPGVQSAVRSELRRPEAPGQFEEPRNATSWRDLRQSERRGLDNFAVSQLRQLAFADYFHDDDRSDESIEKVKVSTRQKGSAYHISQQAGTKHVSVGTGPSQRGNLPRQPG